MAENNNPVSIETTKAFKVPVEKLYAAWIEGDQLKKWWHPFGKNLTNVKNELKNGGAIRYEFDGDQKCQVTGEYNEVVENKKLVYSWNWDLEHDDMKNGDYTLTIGFESAGDGSRLNIKQEGFEEEIATAPHKQGWERGLEALRSYLEGDAAGQQTDNRRDIDQDEIGNRADDTVQQQKDTTKKQADSGSGQSKNEGSTQPVADNQEAKSEGQPENADAARSVSHPQAKAESQTGNEGITKPAADDPKTKAEGQPETPGGNSSDTGGKGPKPIGPNQQTWENPEPGEDMKNKISEQKEKLRKLHENPNAQDPQLEELNKKQDIESRNEAPPHDKKSENAVQEDFDPGKHKTEAPAH